MAETSPELLSRIAGRVWGAIWANAAARLIGGGGNLARRIRSMRKAAEEGREYPGAVEVIEALAVELERAAKELRAHSRKARRMSRMNWTRARGRKPTEEAFPKEPERGGAWSHTKPAPVKRYSRAEREAFERDRREHQGEEH